MKLYATITSERASKGQGGNDFVYVEFTLADRTVVAQVELKLFEDTKDGYDTNEYVLQWRRGGDEQDNDWDILDQDNIVPERTNTKGNKQKGDTSTQLIRRQLREDREQEAFNAGMQ